MDIDFTRQAYIGIGLWVFFKFAAIVSLAVTYTGPSPTGEKQPTPASFVLFFGLGTLALMWAAYSQSVDKGYPAYFALLGLFELLGLIVLAVLPDRSFPPPRTPMRRMPTRPPMTNQDPRRGSTTRPPA